MAQIACVNCGNTCEIKIDPNVVRGQAFGRGTPSLQKQNAIEGALICSDCGAKSIFGLRGDAVYFYPGKALYGNLNSSVPATIVELFMDAILCYQGAGFKGASAMCRACVEQALELKGYKQNKLEDQIEAAKKAGDLTDREYMLAHGSRLVGNDALHKAKSVLPSDLPSVLSVTVSIVNHLFR